MEDTFRSTEAAIEKCLGPHLKKREGKAWERNTISERDPAFQKLHYIPKIWYMASLAITVSWFLLYLDFYVSHNTARKPVKKLVLRDSK